MVEHVIGNDGVVSPILTSGTSFLLSPYFKGFFYAFFQAIFNTNRHQSPSVIPSKIFDCIYAYKISCIFARTDLQEK